MAQDQSNALDQQKNHRHINTGAGRSGASTTINQKQIHSKFKLDAARIQIGEK